MSRILEIKRNKIDVVISTSPTLIIYKQARKYVIENVWRDEHLNYKREFLKNERRCKRRWDVCEWK